MASNTTSKLDEELFDGCLDDLIQMKTQIRLNKQWLTVLSIMFMVLLGYALYPNLVELYNSHITFMETQIKECSVYIGTKLLEYSGSYNNSTPEMMNL